MAEYMDREKIISKTCSSCTRQIDFEYQYEKPCSKLIAAFLNEDPADVAPVVHGRWIRKQSTTIETTKCSVCGKVFQAYYSDYQYCPRCGAKMDGGEKANE